MQDSIRELFANYNQEIEVDRGTSSRYLTLPGASSMRKGIIHAVYTLFNFTADNAIEGGDRIPKALIKSARGLMFLTVAKAGFIVSGRYGNGIIIARLPDDSWSAPSSVSLTGVGWGLQMGGEIMDIVLVLRTDGAVNTFKTTTQVALGTGLSITIGPVGRAAETDIHVGKAGAAAAYSCM